MELRNCEEREEIINDGQRIKNFQKQINEIFDKNLDSCLNKFMKKYNFKISGNEDIVYWIIKYNQFVKDSLE